MGHAYRDMISITHDLLKSDKTPGIIDKSGVGAVGQTISKNSEFANQKNMFMGVAAYWVVSVNLISGRIVTDKA